MRLSGLRLLLLSTWAWAPLLSAEEQPHQPRVIHALQTKLRKLLPPGVGGGAPVIPNARAVPGGGRGFPVMPSLPARAQEPPVSSTHKPNTLKLYKLWQSFFNNPQTDQQGAQAPGSTAVYKPWQAPGGSNPASGSRTGTRVMPCCGGDGGVTGQSHESAGQDPPMNYGQEPPEVEQGDGDPSRTRPNAPGTGYGAWGSTNPSFQTGQGQGNVQNGGRERGYSSGVQEGYEPSNPDSEEPSSPLRPSGQGNAESYSSGHWSHWGHSQSLNHPAKPYIPKQPGSSDQTSHNAAYESRHQPWKPNYPNVKPLISEVHSPGSQTPPPLSPPRHSQSAGAALEVPDWPNSAPNPESPSGFEGFGENYGSHRHEAPSSLHYSSNGQQQSGGYSGGHSGGQQQSGGYSGGQSGGYSGGQSGGYSGGQSGGYSGGQQQSGGHSGGQQQSGGHSGGQQQSGGHSGGQSGGYSGGQSGGYSGGQQQSGGYSGGQQQSGGHSSGHSGGQSGGQSSRQSGGYSGGRQQQSGGYSGGRQHSGGQSGGQHSGGQSGGYSGGQQQSGGYSGGQQQSGGYSGGQQQSGGYSGGQHSGGQSGGQHSGGQSGGYSGGQHSGGQSGGYSGGQQQSGGYSGGQHSGGYSERPGQSFGRPESSQNPTEQLPTGRFENFPWASGPNPHETSDHNPDEPSRPSLNLNVPPGYQAWFYRQHQSSSSSSNAPDMPRAEELGHTWTYSSYGQNQPPAFGEQYPLEPQGSLTGGHSKPGYQPWKPTPAVETRPQYPSRTAAERPDQSRHYSIEQSGQTRGQALGPGTPDAPTGARYDAWGSTNPSFQTGQGQGNALSYSSGGQENYEQSQPDSQTQHGPSGQGNVQGYSSGGHWGHWSHSQSPNQPLKPYNPKQPGSSDQTSDNGAYESRHQPWKPIVPNYPNVRPLIPDVHTPGPQASEVHYPPWSSSTNERGDPAAGRPEYSVRYQAWNQMEQDPGAQEGRPDQPQPNVGIQTWQSLLFNKLQNSRLHVPPQQHQAPDRRPSNAESSVRKPQSSAQVYVVPSKLLQRDFPLPTKPLHTVRWQSVRFHQTNEKHPVQSRSEQQRPGASGRYEHPHLQARQHA